MLLQLFIFLYIKYNFICIAIFFYIWKIGYWNLHLFYSSEFNFYLLIFYKLQITWKPLFKFQGQLDEMWIFLAYLMPIK